MTPGFIAGTVAVLVSASIASAVAQNSSTSTAPQAGQGSAVKGKYRLSLDPDVGNDSASSASTNDPIVVPPVSDPAPAPAKAPVRIDPAGDGTYAAPKIPAVTAPAQSNPTNESPIVSPDSVSKEISFGSSSSSTSQAAPAKGAEPARK
jgi:hypothetical protein